MTMVFRSVARAILAVTIALGVAPPAVSVFELLQLPAVRIVALAKRRRIDYSELFGAGEDAV